MSKLNRFELDKSKLDAILQSAHSHYQAGNLGEAEALYLQVLQQKPQSISALSWLAAIAERTGRPEAAIAHYEQILSLHPNSSETHSNLGSLLCQQGRVKDAIAHHQQALALSPQDPDAHYNLGVVFYQDRQLEAAVQHYKEAIALRPNYANAHNNLGVTLCQLKRQQEAIVHYQQAVLLNPDHANAHNNFGVALAQTGKTADAIAHYERALDIDPHVSNAHDNLGTALKELGRLKEAIVHYRQAIDLKPQQANPHDNLGVALQAQGDLEGAIAEYRQAIILEPTYANAYGNLATALKERGKFEEAIAVCEQALEIEPQNLHVHNAYGGVLADYGDIAGAIVQFEQALQTQPNHADTHLNLGMMLLTAGDFQRGFAEYHWRWQTNQCPNLRYIESLWNGAELHNHVILLTAEQGFGDTIQFVRYAPLVVQKGGQVVVACQRALLRLLQTVPGVTRCIDRDRVDVETHVHAPLLDLPLLLGTTLATIPAQPYLSAPPEAQIQLKKFPGTNLKIGFVWSTNPANSTSVRRSCDLLLFLSLLEIPEVALYSLQKDCPEAERAKLTERDRLQDLNDQIRDFADTAAAIEQLDLIISVDTAVAHLAGALGKPVWTLLPTAADWRWMRDRPDTPWYPTMRLFRQSEVGNWAEVFGRVREALQLEMERLITHTDLDSEHNTLGFLLASLPRSPLAPLKKEGTRTRVEVPLFSKVPLFSNEAVSSEAARNATQNAEAAIALSHQATQLLRQGDLEAAVLGYRQAIELQ
ncbi:MAG TPA: tetratricopeptide repeat protein, partial [Thermosynechococcaceae cyanobacterium]